MTWFLRPWQDLLWGQLEAARRVYLLRRLLAATIAVLLLLGPYDAFSGDLVRAAADVPLSALSRWIAFASCDQIVRWVAVTAALIVAMGLGKGTLANSVAFAFCWIGFGALCLLAAELTPTPFNYNTHLVIFSALISVGDLTISKDKPVQRAYASFVLGLAQIYIGLFYFQSALSKLVHAGIDWFLTGRTAWVFSQEIGTPLGAQLAAYPELFSVLATIVGIFELMFLPLFVYRPQTRYLLPVAATGMHLSFYMLLDIGFWHLWVLYPAVFFDSGWRRKLFSLSGGVVQSN